MKSLAEYLDETGCEEKLKELIMLITGQAMPIREAFINNQSYLDTKNESGETQAGMDVWADDHITGVLEASGLVSALASEEQDQVSVFGAGPSGYSVVMDPMDGSSLISVNLAVGTIVGIYEGDDVMLKGREMKAAFYMLYGPLTVLTITTGSGVAIFNLDKDGVFRLAEDKVRMPEGKLYGSGGLKPEWVGYHERLISYLEGQGCKLRYTGSFVADFHQILKYGGVYCYPELEGKPQGKLRLLFEGNPIGFIAVNAGGAISNGRENLLDIKPEKIHQRTPIYVGSRWIIEKVEEFSKSA